MDPPLPTESIVALIWAKTGTDNPYWTKRPSCWRGFRYDSMRAVFVDFMKLGKPPDLRLQGYTLPIGAERDRPALATLHRGEQVVATDGGEFWVEGEAIAVEQGDLRWWYVHKIATWHDFSEEPLPAGTTRVVSPIT